MGVTVAECKALADVADLLACIERQAGVLTAFAEASRPSLNTWVIASLTEPKPSAQQMPASISARPAATAGTTVSSAPQAAASQPAAERASLSYADLLLKARPRPQAAPAESGSGVQTAAETDRVAPGEQQVVAQAPADLASEQEGQVST